MKTAAKILLTPIWLLKTIQHLTYRLAAGIGIYVLTFGVEIEKAARV